VSPGHSAMKMPNGWIGFDHVQRGFWSSLDRVRWHPPPRTGRQGTPLAAELSPDAARPGGRLKAPRRSAFARASGISLGRRAVHWIHQGSEALWDRWRERVARQTTGPDLRIDRQPDSCERRTLAIGRLGEALVRAELEKLGWPLLSNVVLACGAWSVEIDHLVRAPDGIIVIETKTLSGVVRGEPDAEWWFQRTRSGVSRFLNPLFQNNVHQAAVRAVIPDLEVALRGLVGSAGRARFEASIVRCVVCLHDLVMVLTENVVVPFSVERAIATAWAALVAEAERSERQRAAHVAYVRSCKRLRPT
jgi:hypothetical protein